MNREQLERYFEERNAAIKPTANETLVWLAIVALLASVMGLAWLLS